MRFFGYFEGMPYDRANEKFEDYKKLKNSIPRSVVMRHIEMLEDWATSLPSKDIFTGEKLQAGIYMDGDFRFPREFLHYYQRYDIGIPYDYEEYLKGILFDE